MFSRLSLLSVAFVGALLTLPSAARACDPPPCCTYKTVVCYEKVTEYETRQVSYTRTITCYDECGRPYTVVKTCYRDVRVPVTRLVAVTKQVKVCY